MVGYTPQIATAVWVGSKDPKKPEIIDKDGGDDRRLQLPGAIWQRFMNAALNGEVTRAKACPATEIGDQDAGNGTEPPPPAAASQPSRDAAEHLCRARPTGNRAATPATARQPRTPATPRDPATIPGRRTGNGGHAVAHHRARHPRVSGRLSIDAGGGRTPDVRPPAAFRDAECRRPGGAHRPADAG